MVNKEVQFGEGGVLLPSEFFFNFTHGKINVTYRTSTVCSFAPPTGLEE